MRKGSPNDTQGWRDKGEHRIELIFFPAHHDGRRIKSATNLVHVHHPQQFQAQVKASHVTVKYDSLAS